MCCDSAVWGCVGYADDVVRVEVLCVCGESNK